MRDTLPCIGASGRGRPRTKSLADRLMAEGSAEPVGVESARGARSRHTPASLGVKLGKEQSRRVRGKHVGNRNLRRFAIPTAYPRCQRARMSGGEREAIVIIDQGKDSRAWALRAVDNGSRVSRCCAASSSRAGGEGPLHPGDQGGVRPSTALRGFIPDRASALLLERRSGHTPTSAARIREQISGVPAIYVPPTVIEDVDSRRRRVRVATWMMAT